MMLHPETALPMLVLSLGLALLHLGWKSDSFVYSATSQRPQADIIDTGYSRYLGIRNRPTSVAYLGIPYAEPPLQDLRFRAPVPLNTTRLKHETAGAIVDATQYPEFCIQGATRSTEAGGAGSEDCLKVNIYTPVGAKLGSNLPVLFYIHGGGYIYGNPRNWPFDHWIEQSPNVVIVSVYYRLSAFGFLSTPDFSDGKLGDHNAGFLDQVQALKWVQKNIARFGGNPNKVTINGESAGGGSVQLHLVAKGTKGLFSGAIAQSVYRISAPTPAQAQPLFDFYSNHAGCGTGTVQVKLACLRQASVSALVRAQDAASASDLSYNFHPVIDGKVITAYQTTSILAGDIADVPLIVGATSNETVSGGATFQSSLKGSHPGLTDADLAEWDTYYPSSDFVSESQRFRVVTGEAVLICATTLLGEAYEKINKAWAYRYNQRNPTGQSLAVEHAAENWMMFLGSNTGANGSATFTPQTPTEESFAAELIAYWLSFVRTANPNTYKLPRSPLWTQYRVDNARMVLQQNPQNATAISGSFVERQPALEARRCRFVGSKAEHMQN